MNDRTVSLFASESSFHIFLYKINVLTDSDFFVVKMQTSSFQFQTSQTKAKHTKVKLPHSNYILALSFLQ